MTARRRRREKCREATRRERWRDAGGDAGNVEGQLGVSDDGTLEETREMSRR